KTFEYHIATWTQQHLPGWRIMSIGSIGLWYNTFRVVPQFAGGSFPTAPNPLQLRAATELEFVRDSTIPPIWYRAYGVDAVVIPGEASPDFWKPHQNGHRFDGILPVLWDEQDTRIYAVPRPVRTLAHVVAPGALVSRAPAKMADTVEIEKYVTAI